MSYEIFEPVKPKKRGAPKKDTVKKGYYYRLSLREHQSVTYLLDTMRQEEKLKKKNLVIKEESLISDDNAICYGYKQFYAVSDYEILSLENPQEKPIQAFGVLKETAKSFHLAYVSAYSPNFEDELRYYNGDKESYMPNNKPYIVIDKKNFKCLSNIGGYSSVLYPNYKRALAALLLFHKSSIISRLKTSANTQLLNNFLNICSNYPLTKGLEYIARSLEMDYLFNTEGLFVEQEFEFEKNYFKNHSFDEYKGLLKMQDKSYQVLMSS